MTGFFSTLLQPQMQQQKMAPQIPPHGILGKIANGLNRFSDELLAPTTGLGKLGMYLGAAAGSDLGEAQMAAHQDRLAADERDTAEQIKLIQLQRLLQPEVKEAGGSLYSIEPGTGTIRQLVAAKPKDPPAIQQNFEWFKGLSEADQRLARPMLGGFQWTPEGMAAAIAKAGQIANLQGEARANYRAPETPKYEYRTNPATGKVQRRRVN